MDIVAASHAAGITGCGAAGIPLAGRLRRTVDRVIANGVECEPLLAADQAVLVSFPEQVLRGLALALEATRADVGTVALRAGSPGAAAMSPPLGRHPAFTAEILPDSYPSGDAASLVQRLTGRRIPAGGHPEDVGVLVINVHTLFFLSEAAHGIPMTHRFVTVAGAVRVPQTLRVPLGSQVSDVAALCGGTSAPDVRWIAGGPLRGHPVAETYSVASNTSALLALPSDHPVIRRNDLSLTAMVKRGASLCGGCRVCTDRCPPAMAGEAIAPHRLMRTLALGQTGDREILTGGVRCSGCRVCEAVCPGQLSPGRLYRAVQEVLERGGPMGGQETTPAFRSPPAGPRLLPRPWLTHRLGMAPFAAELPINTNYQDVPRVRLALEGADPAVSVGQRVTRGSLVALGGPRGIPIFSPLEGRVTSLDGHRLEIQCEAGVQPDRWAQIGSHPG